MAVTLISLFIIYCNVSLQSELGTRRNDYGRRCYWSDFQPGSLTPRRSPSAATRGPLSLGGGWWRRHVGSTPGRCDRRTCTSN